MYDINLKNIKVARRDFILIFSFGVVLLIAMIGLYISNEKKLKSMDSVVEAQHVEVVEEKSGDTIMYRLKYHYEVNGKQFTCDSTSASSEYPNTNKTKVYYDSLEPTKCMTEYGQTSNIYFVILILLCLALIVFAIDKLKKIKKRINCILELNQKGKLVKNLQYRLEATNPNKGSLLKPVVDYILPNGVKVTLEGDARHDLKYSDEDGLVDLLIDENNPDNYFIDFEINRLTGNLPSDYYQTPQQ